MVISPHSIQPHCKTKMQHKSPLS